MDTDLIKTEIRQILEALQEQWELLQQHQGKLPQIEIDLIMSNIRKLYEVFNDLRKLNEAGVPISFGQGEFKTQVKTEQPPQIPQPEEPAEPLFISPRQEHKSELPQADIPNTLKLEPRVHPTPSSAEPEKEPQPLKVIPTVVIPPQASKPPLSPDLFSMGTSGGTVSDKLKEDKTTLNEKLQRDQSQQTLGTRLHQNPIKDLKSAIGINEKFQFINELFNGSMQDYTQAVTELNLFNNLEEAIEFVDILKFKYNWDINSDAYHKVMDFIRRRYL